MRRKFLFNASWRLSPTGIKLQGPSLCIRTHGWKFLSKKVDRLLTKNPLSETNVEFGFFVSSFLGQLFCFRISPCWSQHRLGPCSFIPVGDSRPDALNRKLLQHLPQFLIHHSRICLSFHGFHSLSDQCAECFFFAAFVIGNGFWFLRNDFF